MGNPDSALWERPTTHTSWVCRFSIHPTSHASIPWCRDLSLPSMVSMAEPSTVPTTPKLDSAPPLTTPSPSPAQQGPERRRGTARGVGDAAGS